MLDFNGSFHHQQFFLCPTQSQCPREISSSNDWHMETRDRMPRPVKNRLPRPTEIKPRERIGPKLNVYSKDYATNKRREKKEKLLFI